MRPEISWMDVVKEVSAVIGNITGNVFSDKQYPMVESRLKRRCSELKLQTAEDYLRFWKTRQKEENDVLVGLLTTHFTSFFREFVHFEWLAGELPSLIARAQKENRKTLRFWSAACSKGHEVWSLCMFLDYELKRLNSAIDFVVYGSDIDDVSIKEAQNGVYHRRDIETAPRHYWENNCVRGKDDIADWYKIKSALREKTKFFKMNLLRPELPSNEKFDVIFVRNVLIYFDRDNQIKMCKDILSHLYDHGTLITGVSESLSGLLTEIKAYGPSIYKKISAPLPEVVAKPQSALEVPKPLKVFCIDDSPTVLTILKKVLTAPDFEIIGTAGNGEEAIEKLKNLKPDVITLDLHMPVMDGPTFLAQTNIARKIPVVIVSSVDREDPIISKLNNSGVTDIVEKPTLTNIAMIGEELSQKLKTGWKVMKKGELRGELNQGVTKKKRGPAAVVINFGAGDEQKVSFVLSELRRHEDDVTLIFSGDEISRVAALQKINSFAARALEIQTILMRDKLPKLPVVWLHFANGSAEKVKRSKQDTDYVLIEEKKGIYDITGDDISPYTSFSYLIEKVVAGE